MLPAERRRDAPVAPSVHWTRDIQTFLAIPAALVIDAAEPGALREAVTMGIRHVF